MMRGASDRRLDRTWQHLSLGVDGIPIAAVFAENDMPTHKQDPAQPPRNEAPQDEQRRVRPPDDANQQLERDRGSRKSQDVDPDSPDAEVDRDDMIDEP
jgi:hypothetical protein